MVTPAPGLEGLDPANGNLYVNSAGTAGYYSRDRGLGADDMLLTSAGLWIASDNSGKPTAAGQTPLRHLLPALQRLSSQADRGPAPRHCRGGGAPHRYWPGTTTSPGHWKPAWPAFTIYFDGGTQTP